MKKITVLAMLAACATTTFAAPETYVIDSAHTFPRFAYNHFGYSTQLSRFDRTSGTVVFDREARQGTVDVNIDMTSVSTGSALFNEHIQGEDFLDTGKYPTATFKSTRVHFNGNQPSRIDGQLTIKGITRPVSLSVTHFQSMEHPMAKKPAIGANATTTIKRSEFNAGKHAPYVGDEVTLTISLEAIKP